MIKIIGYKTPFDMFGGRVKKGMIYINIDDCKYAPYDIRHELNVNKTHLPREIVELWEPISDNFKIGDTVIVIQDIPGNDANIGYVGAITHMDSTKKPFAVDNSWCRVVRKPEMPEFENFEIKRLIEEAKKRYPVGCGFIPAHTQRKKDVCVVTNENFVYNKRQNHTIVITAMTDEDEFYSIEKFYGNTSHDRIVYADGVWAELADLTIPRICINGHDAVFYEDYIEFGRAKISKEMILDLACLLKKFDDDKFKHIKSIDIGSGTFTVEDIKLIADYYNRSNALMA